MNKSNEFLLETPRITFFLKNNRDIQKTYMLYCRVTLKGTQTEFSLKEKLKKKNWNQSKKKYTGSPHRSEYISTLLESVVYRIKSLALVNSFETAKDLILALTKTTKKIVYVVDLVKNYIDSVKREISPSTLKHHEIKLSNLLRFERYTATRLTSNSFTIPMGEKFIDWFCKEKQTTNIYTASRHVLFYRASMFNAVKKGEIESFKLFHFKGTSDKRKSIIFLNSDEIQSLINQNYVNTLLENIKHLFLFQCYTGLSFCDIWSSWEIEESEAGKILKGKRGKTSSAFFIPLSIEAEQILMKYNYKLPIYSNTTYNQTLKKIANVCGINKRLTSHTGRRTFATLQDSLGWSRESISKMLGHRSFKTTEMYYLGESDARIKNEMLNRKKQ